MNSLANDFLHDEQRRIHGRAEVHLLVAGRTGGATRLVSVHNLSTSGMLIEADGPLETGADFVCDLPQAGLCTGQVVWAQGNFAGCAFHRPIADSAVSAALSLGSRNTEVPEQHPTFEATADFPARLREVRIAHNLSVEDLARKLDVSRQTVWHWEKARNLPSPHHLMQLNRLFGLAPADGPPPAAAVSHSGNLRDLIERTKAELASATGLLPEQFEINITL